MTRLNNKVAMVTDSRLGMGREHALLMAQEGAKLIVTDINGNEIDRIIGSLFLIFKR